MNCNHSAPGERTLSKNNFSKTKKVDGCFHIARYIFSRGSYIFCRGSYIIDEERYISYIFVRIGDISLLKFGSKIDGKSGKMKLKDISLLQNVENGDIMEIYQ